MSKQERDACVDAFARAMKEKLDDNEHKGDREGWRKDAAQALVARLREEVDELEKAIEEAFDNADKFDGVIQIDDVRSVCDEGADVGNFAMFIVDIFDGLPFAPPWAQAARLADNGGEVVAVLEYAAKVVANDEWNQRIRDVVADAKGES